MNIRIVTPATNRKEIDSRCLNSVERLVSSRLASFDFVPAYSTEIGMGRAAAIMAIKEDDGTFSEEKDNTISKALPEFDFVLSLDSDIEFQVEDFEILLDAYSKYKTVVAGCFKARFNKDVINAGYFGKNNAPLIDHDRDILINDLSLYAGKSALRVDWSSFGFSLIPRDVLTQIKKPWFANYVLRYLDKDRIESFRFIHEDVSFSEQLFKNEIPLIVVPSCFVNHLIRD